MASASPTKRPPSQVRTKPPWFRPRPAPNLLTKRAPYDCADNKRKKLLGSVAAKRSKAEKQARPPSPRQLAHENDCPISQGAVVWLTPWLARRGRGRRAQAAAAASAKQICLSLFPGSVRACAACANRR